MMRLWRSRSAARLEEEEHREIPRPDEPGTPAVRLLELQRTIGNQAVLRMLQNRGEPLEEPVRQEMESRFGRDFSNVRVHSGSNAAESAQALQARAYTVGDQIVYGAGQYDPHTHEGRKLLAHELTHVAQQPDGAAPPASDSLRVSDPSEPAEAEAHSLSDRVARGEAVVPAVTANNVVARDRDQSQSKPQVQGPDAQPEQSKPEPETADLTARLDKIAQNYRDMIADARKKGYNVAADNLQRFLDGAGGVKKLDVPWLRGFDATKDAERVNQKRFEGSLDKLAKPMGHGDSKTLEDHWDRMYTASQSTELYYASGTSTIRSTGKFGLDAIEDIVNIGGSVKHHWYDPYDWHEGLGAFVPGYGNISDADALLLQKYRGAKPFMMEADWTERLQGLYTHHNYWFDSSDYTGSGP
jgi:hypothetical protein